MIPAGKLNQRVTFQRKLVERNGLGEEVVTFADVCTVWAEVVPLRGREFFAAAQLQQAVDIRVRIRARSGLAGDMRLLWREQPYDITAIIPGTERYAGLLEIMAVNGVRHGT
ncbi:phage head closure protein [Pseudomonas sp.]|uniref:phage head closure protein n=1 Tax=Pseudomonas sp. TaxID=306 RepID=UPI003F2DD37E